MSAIRRRPHFGSTWIRHTDSSRTDQLSLWCAWLYDDGNGGASAVLLHYEAGARVSEHEHVDYEHMFILEGDEFDENGSYPAGSFVVNPPATRHSPGSRGGCVALLIYQKAVRFTDGQTDGQ